MARFLLQMIVLLLLAGYGAAKTAPRRADSAAAELGRSDSVTDINDLMEVFFCRENSLTIDSWKAMLPTADEVDEMRQLLSLLYDSDSIRPDVISKFPRLSQYVDVTIFKNNYYLVHEKFPPVSMEHFARCWGYVMIAKKSFTLRNLHHSAAHFESDGAVCTQAATLFDSSRGRSLNVAGANRFAVKGNYTTPCQPENAVADAAHATETMFNSINVILKDLADKEAKAANRISDAVFIQWHGMAETSCLKSDVFISTGLANNSIYDSDIPATRLQRTFNSLATTMVASTPRQDFDCRLTATTNVFGRYVNGVPLEKTCNTAAKPGDVTGQFVHVEQKRPARDDLSLWCAVVSQTFPVSSGTKPKKTRYELLAATR